MTSNEGDQVFCIPLSFWSDEDVLFLNIGRNEFRYFFQCTLRQQQRSEVNGNEPTARSATIAR
jgi:hypothetical protein